MRLRCERCGRRTTVRPASLTPIGSLDTMTDRAPDDPTMESAHNTLESFAPPPLVARPAAASPNNLFLRQEGLIYAVQDQAGLQRWIVERRVLRTDEVSTDGTHWQVVGDRADLMVFFDLVDTADRVRAVQAERAPGDDETELQPEGEAGAPADPLTVEVDPSTVESPGGLDTLAVGPAPAGLSRDLSRSGRESDLHRLRVPDEALNRLAPEAIDDGGVDEVNPEDPTHLFDEVSFFENFGAEDPTVQMAEEAEHLVEMPEDEPGATLKEDDSERLDLFFENEGFENDGAAVSAFSLLEEGPTAEAPRTDAAPVPSVERPLELLDDHFLRMSARDDEEDEEEFRRVGRPSKAFAPAAIALILFVLIAVLWVMREPPSQPGQASATGDSEPVAAAAEVVAVDEPVPSEGAGPTMDAPVAESEAAAPPVVAVVEPAPVVAPAPQKAVEAAPAAKAAPKEAAPASAKASESSAEKSAPAAPASQSLRASDLEKKGWSAMDRGDLDGAGRYFRQGLDIDPRHAGSSFGLGYVLEHKGDLAGAKVQYCKADSLSGKDRELAREIDGRLRALKLACP